MPCSTLQAEILADTYEDLHKLVFKITHKFAALYRIHFDDLIGISNQAYVKACERYNPKKGCSLSTWVYSKVTWELRSHLRQELPALNSNVSFEALQEAGECVLMSHTYPNHFMLDVKASVGSAAQAACAALIESRRDFSTICKWKSVTKRKGIREALREHLRDLGWEHADIIEAFEELRELFSGERERAAQLQQQKDEFRKALEETKRLVARQRRMRKYPKTLRSVDLTKTQVHILTA